MREMYQDHSGEGGRHAYSSNYDIFSNALHAKVRSAFSSHVAGYVEIMRGVTVLPKEILCMIIPFVAGGGMSDFMLGIVADAVFLEV